MLTQAADYRDAATSNGLSGQAAQTAVAFAHAQLGTPYVWGGDGDAAGGFDCSGLTRAVIRIDPIGHYLAAPRPSQGTAT